MTTKNARTYGRWLGARFERAATSSGSMAATASPPASRRSTGSWRAGCATATAVPTSSRVIPAAGVRRPSIFHNDDWLAFNMIETWTEWAKIYPAIVPTACSRRANRSCWAKAPMRNGPEYPQGPITPLVVRRQAWWSVMAGGFHTYGQNQMWRMEPGWDNTFDTPGADNVAKMKEIVTSLPWWEWLPDQGLFATGIGSERT